MNRYSIALQAARDLDEIWDYIGVQNANPAAARRQIEMFFEKFDLLATHPLIGEVRKDLGADLRSFVARNYVIVYRPSKDEIEIARVVHAARDVESLFRSS